MTVDLAIVLVLLVAAIAMFAIGRPRMDVVAVVMIVALPLTGILSVPETLAGFADPNVVLIAALFVVGEGLSRTGVTYRLGDWLARTAGASSTRLIVLLMLSVALLGAIMSSTGVVAIFIPVALSIAARTGMSPRQLMMPLSFAGLISGMLDEHRAGVLMIERKRLFRPAVQLTADDTVVGKGDVLFVDAAFSADERQRFRLERLRMTDGFFDAYSRQVGMAEALVAPASAAIG